MRQTTVYLTEYSHCCEHVHGGLGAKDRRHSTRGLPTAKLEERSVDDVICLVHTGKTVKLQHTDTVDPTGSMVMKKTTACLLRWQVHQKGRWQCEVHHVQEEDAHGRVSEVCRILMNRCEMTTTEEGDKKEEMEHLRGALEVCGYPSWALKRSQTTQKRTRTRSTVGQRTNTTGVK